MNDAAARHMPPPAVTHLEMRRVQNGFVVMALNFTTHEAYGYAGGPQRASYIARDIPELCNILQALVDGAELQWLPTVDLPLIELHTRRLHPTEQATVETKIEDLSNSIDRIAKAVGI